MRRIARFALIAVLLTAARAEAVTVQEIIGLTRAGLGEEVLLALIEVDGSLFPIDAATLTNLKQAGVPERVIQAMVRSGRTRAREPAAEPQPLPEADAPNVAPQIVVIEHERPVIQQVAVPVPLYVPVTQRRRLPAHVSSLPLDPSPGFGAVVTPVYEQKRHPPVYWGWGGKLRPDAWTPAPEDTPRDAGSGPPQKGRRR
jgi:hypothetical protein